MLSTSQIKAQTVNGLTLDEVLEEAYQANPTLKAAMATELIAEAGVIQAGTRINPSYNVQLAPAEQTYHLFDISSTWQMGNKRNLRIQIAKNQIESTNVTVKTLAWKIREDTAQAFFELAIASKALKIMQDYLEVAKNLLNIASKKQAVGEVAYLDVSRTQAALSQIKIDIATYEARLNRARRKLNLIMARPADTAIQVDYSEVLALELPTQLPSFEDLLVEAKKNRIEYSQFNADIKVENSKIKLANSSKWPDVVIGGGLSSVSATRNSFIGENFSYAPEVYFQIPIPIFNRQQGPRATSQATIKLLEAQSIAFTNQVEQEVSLAYSNFEGANKQLHLFLDEVLPEQKEILSLSQKSYDLGFIDLTAAITAQQSALLSQINYCQVLTTYFQTILDIERAIGKPISFDFSQMQLEG